MSGPGNLGIAVLLGLGVWLATIIGCGLGLRGRLRTIVLLLLDLPLAVWGACILVAQGLWPEPEAARSLGLALGSVLLALSLGIGLWASRSWSRPLRA
jgi:hypothetical protein